MTPPAPRVTIYSTNPHQPFCLYRYRNTVKVCPVYVLLGSFLLMLSNDPNWVVVRININIRHHFCYNSGYLSLTPGFPYMELLLTVMKSISNKYNKAYPKCTFLCVIKWEVFGVFFGQNSAHI